MDVEESLSCNRVCDLQMVPSKTICFIRGAARASTVAFLTPFITSLGLSVQEAGIIAGFQCVSSAICSPLWGYAADVSRKRKLCYAILGVGSLITLASLPFVGAVMKELSPSNVSFPKNQTIKTPLLRHGESSYFSSSLFYAMLLIVFCSNLFFNPMVGLEDSFIMNLVNSTKEKDVRIGDQKAFLSVGLALAGISIGYGIDQYTNTIYSKYSVGYFVCIPLLLFAIPVGLFVESQGDWGQQNEKDDSKLVNVLRLLISVIGNLGYASILITALITGISNAVYITFLTQLMQDQMHSTGTPMGLTYMALGLVEAVMFILSERVLSLRGKSVVLIECSLLCYVIPNIAISYLQNAWLVTIFQLLFAGGYVFFWVGAYDNVQKTSHPNIYITLFTILACLYYDLGGVLGNFLGGYIYGTFGGGLLFRGMGYICLGWLLCLVAYHQGLPLICGVPGRYEPIPEE